MALDCRKLSRQVSALFEEEFREYKCGAVPDVHDSRLTHGATGIGGEFTYLYIDMRNSSKLTDRHRRQTVAKMYKAFHLCMVRIIREYQGRVRSFDGDRLMGIFDSNNKIDNAVEAAMTMIGCVEGILVPKMRRHYRDRMFDVGIGIATSEAILIKAGVGHEENSRDLVSIGAAANFAARLSDKAKAPKRIHICPETMQGLSIHNRQYQSKVFGLIPVTNEIWSSESDLNPFLFGTPFAYSTSKYREPDTGELEEASELDEA